MERDNITKNFIVKLMKTLLFVWQRLITTTTTSPVTITTSQTNVTSIQDSNVTSSMPFSTPSLSSNWQMNQTIANTSYMGASTIQSNVVGTSFAHLSSAVSNQAIAGPSYMRQYTPSAPSILQNRFRRRLPNGQMCSVASIKMTVCLPLPVFNTVTSNPPLPPNWNENMNCTFQSSVQYKLFPVHSATYEFKKLTQLLDPLVVREIEQIVNPALWTRFVNTRKEMLKAKCNDPALLKELGLNDEEITRKMQTFNLCRHKAIDDAPYNDNFALLFHCTRAAENVEYILRDSLDERLSRRGLLGNGIYFSDKALKASRYDGIGDVIFIFGVLLGDCKLDTMSSSTLMKKEPEKLLLERRDINDIYFDSIFSDNMDNEYAVYNRYQCCPLYKVKYAAPQNLHPKKVVPSFGWLPETIKNKFDLNKSTNGQWPLHAKKVFDEIEAMKVHDPSPLPIIFPSTSPSKESIDEKLSLLKNIGYTDVALNLKTLKENNYNTKTCVRLFTEQNVKDALKDALLKHKPTEHESSDSEGSPYQSSTDEDEPKVLQPRRPPTSKDISSKPMDVDCSPTEHESSDSEGSPYQSSTDEDEPKERQPSQPSKNTSRKPIISLPPAPLNEDCSICCNTYSTVDNWKTLQCQHKLCVNCFKKLEITRTTMTGVSHTFIKCPFCLVTFGIEIGICPNGEMTERLVASHCEGYEASRTISIQYKVNTGNYHMIRTAFLPDNEEGRNILRLLRIACDRRISFTIGSSHTTGLQNTVVWNIHHKTSLSGGVYRHGYPDSTYFERVIAELKGFGIQ